MSISEEIAQPALDDPSLEDTKELTSLAMSIVCEGVTRGDFEGDPESKSAYLLYVLTGIAFRLGESRQRAKDNLQPLINLNDFRTLGS